jgi:hypothetical protein
MPDVPILGSMTRVAYVTTENTGDELSISGPEGVIQFGRVDPHGVVLQFGGLQLSIHKELLPYLGRYAFAAALKLGVDINHEWDKDQHAAH